MTEENTPQKVTDQSDQENILGLPDEVAQELEKLPPEAKQIMRSFSMQGTVPFVPPIQKKITEEHITRLLEISDKDSQRQLDVLKISETTKRLAIGAVLVLVISVLVYAGITKETFLSQQIINIVVGAFGGVGLTNVFKKKD
jgi:hypothetical protein